ncbi:MAG: hypothetical protein ABL878_19845, partial [Burkholderiales bacterium]
TSALFGGGSQTVPPGEPRVQMEYEYGLTQNLALFGSFAHLTTGDNEQRDYVTAGLGGTLAGTYARLDASHEAQDGGNAVQLTAQTDLWGVSISAQHREFFDFISDYTEQATDPLSAQSVLRADTPLDLPILPRLNFGLAAGRQEYESGRIVDQIENRLSTTINRVSLSHTLAWREDQSGGTTTGETTGDILVSFPLADRFTLRGDATYRLRPETEIDTVALTSEYYWNDDLLTRFEVDKQLSGGDTTTYAASLNQRLGWGQLGALASYSDDSQYTLGMTLSFSLGQNPRPGDIIFSPDAMAGNGLVSASAYLDKNHNSLFDEGDEPVEGASFLQSGGHSPDATGTDGTTLLTGLSTNARTDISLDQESMENPYWISNSDGNAVIARPGVPLIMDFPVTSTGEIEGTVWLQLEDGARKEASNVQIQLVDPQGKVIRESKTAFDGFYLLELVPPGEYNVRIDPEQVTRLGLLAPDPQPVQVQGEDDIKSGVDFSLAHNGDNPAPTAPQEILEESPTPAPVENHPLPPAEAQPASPTSQTETPEITHTEPVPVTPVESAPLAEPTPEVTAAPAEAPKTAISPRITEIQAPKPATVNIDRDY